MFLERFRQVAQKQVKSDSSGEPAYTRELLAALWNSSVRTPNLLALSALSSKMQKGSGGTLGLASGCPAEPGR